METSNLDSKRKIKIYVADNTEFKSKLVTYLENRDDFEVVGSCDDGQKAFIDICALKPDVVLMECVLPSIDGFVVMDKVFEHMGANCPKVIIISSLSHEGFISKAMSQGASYFLCKPITFEIVEQRIFDVLNMNNKPQLQQKTKSPNRALDEKISNIFLTVGIPAHIKGYHFLREAIKMAVEDPEIISYITKRLYPSIAEKFDTTSSKVERAMRHAIEVAWNRGKIENINSIFGLKVYTTHDKPTNGEFIALVADKMIIEGV